MLLHAIALLASARGLRLARPLSTLYHRQQDHCQYHHHQHSHSHKYDHIKISFNSCLHFKGTVYARIFCQSSNKRAARIDLSEIIGFSHVLLLLKFFMERERENGEITRILREKEELMTKFLTKMTIQNTIFLGFYLIGGGDNFQCKRIFQIWQQKII